MVVPVDVGSGTPIVGHGAVIQVAGVDGRLAKRAPGEGRCVADTARQVSGSGLSPW